MSCDNVYNDVLQRLYGCPAATKEEIVTDKLMELIKKETAHLEGEEKRKEKIRLMEVAMGLMIESGKLW